MTILEETLIKEVEDVKEKVRDLAQLEAFTRKQLDFNQETAQLERQYANVSNTAEVADTVTRFARLTDEIYEFTKKRKFYQLQEVIEATIREIKNFRKDFSLGLLPESIFDALENGLKAHRKSLDAMEVAAESLPTIVRLTETSDEKELKDWAENLEVLAEEFEDNLEFFSSEVFDELETLFETVVLRSRNKQVEANNRKREEYRRRLRFAAGFMLNLIEMTREDAMREDEEVMQAMLALSNSTLQETYEEDDKFWQECQDTNKNI